MSSLQLLGGRSLWDLYELSTRLQNLKQRISARWQSGGTKEGSVGWDYH